MSNPTVERIATTNTDALTKSSDAAENIFKANADALTDGANRAERIMKGNVNALTDSSNASSAAFQELAKAYQELSTKNMANMTAAFQAFSAVKDPAEFIELQQRLIKDGIETAIHDSRHIAELTAAMFTAAFEPMKKQIEAVQTTARN
jgi:phasin family protein